jgi:hypothetical protein
MNNKRSYYLLTKEDKKALIELGKRYSEIEIEKNDLLYKTRKIVGFEDPGDFHSFDEELESVWDYTNSHKSIFLDYAQDLKEKLEIKEAVDNFKKILSKHERTIDEIERMVQRLIDWG